MPSLLCRREREWRLQCRRLWGMAQLSMSAESMIVVLSENAEELLQDPVEARKALETIDIRVTNRPISLLQHKLYNVWIAYAQATVNSADTRIFEFPLTEVMEACGFDSHNTEYFISAAKQIFDLRVEYNSLDRQLLAVESLAPAKGKRQNKGPTKWAAAQLISFIEIDSSINRMRVEFPEVIRQEILRPDKYRSIDLHVQAQFTSRAGLALYEYVLRYASEEATPWLPWETYSMLLSGAAEPHKTMREFSKMLKRAIEQVNAHHASHQIHAEFTKRGKAFHRMRIAINLRHQNHMSLSAPAALPAEVLQSLRRMGLKDREIDEIARAHPLDYLQAHISYVQRRFNDRTKDRINVPGAYLRSALQANYAAHRAALSLIESSGAATSAPAVRVIPARTQGVPGAGQSRTSAENEEVRTWYSALPVERRTQLASGFYASVALPIRKLIERSGMESKMALSAFHGWLREQGHLRGPD